MAKTLISSSPFIGTLPPSKFLRHGLYSLPNRSKILSTSVKFSFQEIPPISSIGSSIDLNAFFSKAEGIVYTLADAAVSASPDASGASVQKSGGWFGFISDAMEVVLKVVLIAYLC